MLAFKGKFTCVVGNRNLKRLRENPLNKGLLWKRFKAGVYQMSRDMLVINAAVLT